MSVSKRIALVSAFPPGTQTLNEYGLHLVKVLGLKQDGTAPTMSQQQAQQIVYQQHFMKEQEKTMKKLRKTAYIKIMQD